MIPAFLTGCISGEQTRKLTLAAFQEPVALQRLHSSAPRKRMIDNERGHTYVLPKRITGRISPSPLGENNLRQLFLGDIM